MPLANADPTGFLRGVQRAVAARNYDVVFGVGDAEVLALSETRAQWPAALPYPEHAVVVACIDKGGFVAAARAAGLRTPEEHALDALPDGPGDLVVKQRLNGLPGAGKILARRLADPHEARAYAQDMQRAGGEPLVQEALDGELLALVLLLAPDGRLVAAAQQRADRIFPPDTGISTRARTEPVDRDLAQRAVQMLRSLGWWGLVELQFIDPVSGRPALIDLNARFYGSLALAVEAGVNFPDLWARLSAGLPALPPVEARSGVGYQWLEGDLRRAVVQRQGGLLRDVAKALAEAGGTRQSMWDRRDPAPVVRQLSRLAYRGAAKAAGTLR